jgi:hypothetical protein
MSNQPIIRTRGSAASVRAIHMALNGLEQMVDPESQIFCDRMVLHDGSFRMEGVSHRYAMMTLLGLDAAVKAGYTSPVSINQQLGILLKDLNWISTAGDAGLLIWTCAVIDPDSVDAIIEKLQLRTLVTGYGDARAGHTMELSWVLAGLSHAVMARPATREHLRELANHVYGLIVRNQGAAGAVGHLHRSASVKGFLRGNIGSFADQVYPIYSFSKFSKAFGSEDALNRALACAMNICRVQGSYGEWWWHYEAASGRVIESYPVYSVHQHGMAPMALYAVADASGHDFSKNIERGLAWLEKNELGVNMIDDRWNVAWRCIRRPVNHGRINSTARLMGFGRDLLETPDQLSVLHECRPYELGWLLYGLAPASPAV